MIEQSLQELMHATMEQLHNVVATENITGKPIVVQDGTVIVPLHKVTVGLVSGGGQLDKQESKTSMEMPFAGGGGGGLHISPIGFLVVDGSDRRVLTVDPEKGEDKWTDIFKGILRLARPTEKRRT